MKELFRKAAGRVSSAAGNPSTFLGALLVVVIWASSGKLFNYSNTWQLVINTGTTIITFLMVFLIQNTQNRDSKAMQLKLDELIRASQARNTFIDIEDLTDDELAIVNEEFQRLNGETDIAAFKKLHTKLQQAHKYRSAKKST
ncbi:low affinity iron permease family protein [soil metagenome]